MEADLDEIELGKLDWRIAMGDFTIASARI